jgi:RNA polymerase sigma-70 factor, ECF subfamily
VASGVDASAVIASQLPKLSTADQELLRLHAWDDLPVSEIAFVLSSTETAVKVRLHRARRRLAALVDAHTRAAERGHDSLEVTP